MKKSQAINYIKILENYKLLPEGQRWELSVYNPGDGRRYQLEVVDKDYHIKDEFPRYGHMPSSQFEGYIKGFMDALDYIKRT